jgi:hypothetical protein
MQTTEQPNTGNLRGQGFRFVFEDGRYVWRHALEVRPGAVDCSDMDDDEFAQFVADNEVAA